MKGRPNPYARRLKSQVTMRLSDAVIADFEALAEETGIPCRRLINLYLRDCVANQRRPAPTWR